MSKEEFGIPDWASWSVDWINEAKYRAVEILSPGSLRWYAPGVGLAIGSVDVIDAIENGTTQDVITQSGGLAGSLAGAGLGGSWGAGVGGAFLGPPPALLLGEFLVLYLAEFSAKMWLNPLSIL